MKRSFNGGAVHVKVSSLAQGLEYCKLGGFDSLAMGPNLLNDLSTDEAKSMLAEANVAPGAWGVPFDFRGDEATHDAGLAKLPEIAAKMAEVGVTRCATWILPGSNDRNWDQNWAFHVRRLKPIADILNDHGMTFGLEFVGPKTLRNIFRHPFVYTLNEVLDLGSRVGRNVGVLVDCWHLYTSEGTNEELSLIDARQIALVHINDAPAGKAVDEQVDNQRLLPCDSGVIDLKGFFETLRKIGYDGPVEIEPFLDSLKELPSDEERVKVVGAAMSKAFSL
jgi:sugar phosphate isomerase/epimerase